jgi:hypothetical protein
MMYTEKKRQIKEQNYVITFYNKMNLIKEYLRYHIPNLYEINKDDK